MVYVHSNQKTIKMSLRTANGDSSINPKWVNFIISVKLDNVILTYILKEFNFIKPVF